MKVLHILSSNRFSGAENVACQIIDMMKSCPAYEMAYCSPDGQIRQALSERGVRFVPIRDMTMCEIRRVLKEEKPDAIHAHDMRASFLAALVCGTTPLVSHIHNNNFDSRKVTVKAVLYRLAAAKTRHIFWVSRSAQMGYCFRRGVSRKSSVLHNTINVPQLMERAAQAEVNAVYDIVFLGRLTYPKNPERMIEVLEKVIQQVPNARAAIIGSGELELTIQHIIAQKNLQNSVQCHGFMSNPYGILKNAKVMLMTSRWEGLPMCALESLALGVPVVSTPTDGMNELIEDGKNGYLSDHDEVLADSIIQLISNPQLHSSMSIQARQMLAHFNNTDEYICRLTEAYGHHV